MMYACEEIVLPQYDIALIAVAVVVALVFGRYLLHVISERDRRSMEDFCE